jgi:hypothetical protein
MNRLLLLSVIATGLLLVVVVYLIRTRRLHERFALIWLAGAIGIAVLAVWGSALNAIADWAGIAYPPNVLFVVGGGFVLWVLLHSAVVMTRVVKQNTQLAQRVAMLETEIDDLKKTSGQDGDMSATRQSVARP